MSGQLLIAWLARLLMPEGLFLCIYLSMANIWLDSSVGPCSRPRCYLRAIHTVWYLQIDIFIHLLVWATIGMTRLILLTRILSCIYTFVCCISWLLSCEEAFEDYVRKLAVHKRIVNVDQNAWRLRLNDANVVNTPWAYSYNFAVHERLNKLWCLADCFYAIVVRGLKWRRWHQRANHCNVRILILMLLIERVDILTVHRFMFGASTLRICSISTWLSWRWADWVWWFKTTHKGHSVIIGDLGESNFFVALSALLVKLILILPKLTTSICTKTVKMSTISKSHCMSFTAWNSHNLLVAQSLDSCRVRLVWLVFSILG